jgi:hypothetical protein
LTQKVNTERQLREQERDRYEGELVEMKREIEKVKRQLAKAYASANSAKRERPAVEVKVEENG